MKDYQPIGEMLVYKHKLTREKLSLALEKRRSSRRRLGEILIDMGFVTENDVMSCLSEQFGFDTIDPSRVMPETSALQVIDVEFALSHCVLPFRLTRDVFECAISDPIDIATTDAIRQLVPQRTKFRIAPASKLTPAIRRAYRLETDTLPIAAPRIPRVKTIRRHRDREALLSLLSSV